MYIVIYANSILYARLTAEYFQVLFNVWQPCVLIFPTAKRYQLEQRETHTSEQLQICSNSYR